MLMDLKNEWICIRTKYSTLWITALIGRFEDQRLCSSLLQNTNNRLTIAGRSDSKNIVPKSISSFWNNKMNCFLLIFRNSIQCIGQQRVSSVFLSPDWILISSRMEASCIKSWVLWEVILKEAFHYAQWILIAKTKQVLSSAEIMWLLRIFRLHKCVLFFISRSLERLPFRPKSMCLLQDSFFYSISSFLDLHSFSFKLFIDLYIWKK